jgi:hypothetical protein
MTAPRRRWFRIAFNLRTLFLLVTLLCVGAAGCEIFLATHGARFFVELIAEFETMPVDDSELTAWLRIQPQVVPDSIQIIRKGEALIVAYSIDRSLKGYPAYPDLDTQCKSLGYAGPNGTFRAHQ